MKVARKIVLLLFVLFSMVILSCGGGDDGGDGNSAPTANAGSDQTVTTGDTVTLDGTGSSDPDGDTLTYSWSFDSKPTGSTAQLSDDTVANPQFTADLDGTYVVSLIVNDGSVDSDSDSVTITASTGGGNSAPTADAGPDQTVTAGDTVNLDGSGSSDPDADALTFSWSFTSRPSGSTAQLSNANIIDPQFTADLDGTYVVSLVVNDGTVNSAADSVSITAEVSFSGQVQPIFNANCTTACHESGGSAGLILILTSGVSHGNLVNQPATQSAGTRVIPNDSANSVLYLRVSGTSVGAQMPLVGGPLSTAEQGLIQTWIDEGALNN